MGVFSKENMTLATLIELVAVYDMFAISVMIDKIIPSTIGYIADAILLNDGFFMSIENVTMMFVAISDAKNHLKDSLINMVNVVHAGTN